MNTESWNYIPGLFCFREIIGSFSGTENDL